MTISENALRRGYEDEGMCKREIDAALGQHEIAQERAHEDSEPIEPVRISIVPSWAAILPVLVEVAANGSSAAGRREAMEQLIKLAEFVDEANRTAKAKRKIVQDLLIALAKIAHACEADIYTDDPDFAPAMDNLRACLVIAKTAIQNASKEYPWP